MKFEEVVNHKRNDNWDYETSKVGDTIYLIRWSKQTSTKDTSEPTHHVPGRQFVNLYENRVTSYLSDILNTFVMRLEKGETKCESSYKPPINTDIGEDKHNRVDEKENSIEFKKILITKL